ncbi:MAG TPA: methyltransferase domain-containing protein [Kribbella sp.]|jgi:protein-L-isoaspartate(D-aspartate) O-methyltransferase
MPPRDLVRLLIDKGVLTDQRVADAMAAVPRELFVPDDRREEAYADKVLVTKWDDAGVAISSASQPAMVAIMLEQLRLDPGHSVLEIGAGTGYNAALLGRLADQVVTVDIDEDIAREARDRLAGVTNVEVRAGDGWAGAPDRAPYDRIELTIGTSDISVAWRDQVADGGLLVLPLWLRVGVQLSVAFRRDGDVLRSESVRDCGFQRFRGPNSGPEGFVAVGGGEFVVLDDASDAAPLRDVLRHSPREERAPVVDPGVFARIALDEPRTLALSDLSGALRPGLYDAGGAVVLDNERMLTYGSPAARDRLIYRLSTTRPLDRSRLRVTAAFTDLLPPPSQGWRFVRRSCVVDVAEGP